MRRISDKVRLGISILLMILIGTVYVFYVKHKIMVESWNHLHEVYGQVNKTFSGMVVRNWNVLSGWSDYIHSLVV